MSPRRNWDSPNPSLASEWAPPPRTGGRGGTLACGWGAGESQIRRLEKSLALFLLCGTWAAIVQNTKARGGTLIGIFLPCLGEWWHFPLLSMCIIFLRFWHRKVQPTEIQRHWLYQILNQDSITLALFLCSWRVGELFKKQKKAIVLIDYSSLCLRNWKVSPPGSVCKSAGESLGRGGGAGGLPCMCACKSGFLCEHNNPKYTWTRLNRN
jgi:hypothetical protein